MTRGINLLFLCHPDVQSHVWATPPASQTVQIDRNLNWVLAIRSFKKVLNHLVFNVYWPRNRFIWGFIVI